MRSRPTRSGASTAKVSPVFSAGLTSMALRPVSRVQASARTLVRSGTTLHTITPSQASGVTPRRPSRNFSSAVYSSPVQRGRVTMRAVNSTFMPSSPPMQMLLLPISTARIIGSYPWQPGNVSRSIGLGQHRTIPAGAVLRIVRYCLRMMQNCLL